MRALITIEGLYQTDPSLFNSMSLPDGVSRETLVANLLLDLMGLEVLYPDAAKMKSAITVWSAISLPVWERIKAACEAEYNPIENYDRKEDWTDNGTSSGTAQNTNLSKVAGFNAEDMVNRTSDTDNGTSSSTANTIHTGRTHGNIGVTTSQQMLTQELEIAPELNIYRYIIEDFKQRFCLMVY